MYFLQQKNGEPCIIEHEPDIFRGEFYESFLKVQFDENCCGDSGPKDGGKKWLKTMRKKIVEYFGRKCKKMEKITYLCNQRESRKFNLKTKTWSDSSAKPPAR